MSLKTLISEAYDLAHKHNSKGHNTQYTHDEAIQYDPLVSKLHEALRLLDNDFQKHQYMIDLLQEYIKECRQIGVSDKKILDSLAKIMEGTK